MAEKQVSLTGIAIIGKELSCLILNGWPGNFFIFLFKFEPSNQEKTIIPAYDGSPSHHYFRHLFFNPSNVEEILI
ncbi:MAG: hypothetical protein DWQ02_17690 [Bacteroidetes bacterium]|nr:MAG: hypothetical protein DWQ02_17690 [Bacteroidota bacterium]